MNRLRQFLSSTLVVCSITLFSLGFTVPGFSSTYAHAAEIGEETAIILESVECVEDSNTFGSDEVIIKYSIDGGIEKKEPPNGNHEMDDGDLWMVNLPLTFKDSAKVNLIEDDFAGSDSLGGHTYYPGDTQPDSITVSGHDATYILKTRPAS